jgi:PKHD-type hydroxylase
LIGRLVVTFPPGHGGLPAHLVEALRSAAEAADMVSGAVGPTRSGRIDTSVRASGVRFVGPEEVGEEAFAHFLTLAVVANRQKGWGLALSGMSPRIQATRYGASELGHYDWHTDWGPGPNRGRKVTAVAQLSDPASYTGGRLMVTSGARPVAAPAGVGTVTVFPSFLLHRVTPVTSGVRLSAVAWILGPPLR